MEKKRRYFTTALHINVIEICSFETVKRERVVL